MAGAASGLRAFTLAEGVLLVVLGVLALIFPLLASVWVTALVAVAFLVGGIVGWINAVARAGRLTALHSLMRMVVATLFVMAGIWMIRQIGAGPVAAAAQVASLALAIGVVFLAEGLAEIVVALGHRQVRGWGWGLTNGIVTLILGGLILTMKFWNLLWVLGLLVGISFLFSGLDLLSFSASFHPEEDDV
ncbi:MAG: DUF308 domain-containing protein [Cyanobacteriota bacterium]|jgi:uncharacterized membrane protein HdeD (DUF308 family)